MTPVLREKGFVFKYVENPPASMPPQSVKIIGLDDKNIQNLVIPNTLQGHPVVEIGERAFIGSMVESLYFPSNVRCINWGACMDCKNLRTITFEGCPELIYFHGVAFCGCYNLQDVVMLNAAQQVYLHGKAFNGCRKLAKFDGVIMGWNPEVFNNCSQLTKVSVSDRVIMHWDALKASSIETIRVNGSAYVDAFLREDVLAKAIQIECDTDSALVDLSYNGYAVTIK